MYSGPITLDLWKLKQKINIVAKVEGEKAREVVRWRRVGPFGGQSDKLLEVLVWGQSLFGGRVLYIPGVKC